MLMGKVKDSEGLNGVSMTIRPRLSAIDTVPFFTVEFNGLFPAVILMFDPTFTGFGPIEKGGFLKFTVLFLQGNRFMYCQISLLNPTAIDADPLPPGALPIRIKTNF